MDVCERWDVPLILSFHVIDFVRNSYPLITHILWHILCSSVVCLFVLIIASEFYIFDESSVSNNLWNKITY